MQKTKRRNQKLVFLCFSLIGNLGLLFTFKYLNFFNESFRVLFGWINLSYGIPHLEILLPVGISFFTIQTVGYLIDVYRGKVMPERHFGIFALYVAFFPKLIAGPIERAANLLPQFWRKHEMDLERAFSGTSLLTWGIFKKVVIADRLAIFVDMVFNHPQDYWGQTLVLAAYFFTLQIYCDFSGYTDIARGCGKILGFNLMENFNFPYFACSIPDFWRRWHISLTSWFRDYLYVPLGGKRVNPTGWGINILIVFILSGLWHGANWTFVLWGTLHGFFYLFGKITQPARRWMQDALRIKGSLLIILQMLVTFHLVCLSWIFFRAKNLSDATYIVSHLFSRIATPAHWGPSQFTTILTCFLALAFILIEVIQYRWSARAFSPFRSIPFAVKCPAYCFVVIAIFLFGVSRNEFIYFHF
jgi:D-alanyl-lipoteichoic acid acyltransferase DltB (MBOAT superfamily)